MLHASAAPTNEAFGKLPEETLKYLRDSANSDQLMNLLLYHVVPATNAVSFTLQDGPLETLSGASISVKTGSAGITVDGASVVDPDVIASNGIIHVIDEVLIPADLVLPSGDKPPTVRSTPNPTDDPFLPPGTSPGDASKVPTYAPTSATLAPGQTYAPTKDTPIPTYAPSEGEPDIQAPPNTIGKKKKKKDSQQEEDARAPTYRPTEPWPTYAPTPFEMETRISGYLSAEKRSPPAAAAVGDVPPSWSPTSSTYYPTVATYQPTSVLHARNLADHSSARRLADATTAGEWASVPPNDGFFQRFPEWRERQEEIYRLRASRGRSKRLDGSRTRRLQTTAPDAQYHDLAWGDLPPNIQGAYKALGYTESYWCYGGEAPATESMSWAELSPMQRGAARALGYYEKSWDAEAGVTEEDDAYYYEGEGDSISIGDIGIGEEEGSVPAEEGGEDLVPNQLLSAQFLEIDTSMDMNIINQDDQYVNVTFPTNPDGGPGTDFGLSFTSVSATLDPGMPLEDQADLLPGGVILILVARTAGGEVVRNRVFWTYTMGCQLDDVTIQSGDEFGWTLFVSTIVYLA